MLLRAARLQCGSLEGGLRKAAVTSSGTCACFPHCRGRTPAIRSAERYSQKTHPKGTAKRNSPAYRRIDGEPRAVAPNLETGGCYLVNGERTTESGARRVPVLAVGLGCERLGSRVDVVLVSFGRSRYWCLSPPNTGGVRLYSCLPASSDRVL